MRAIALILALTYILYGCSIFNPTGLTDEERANLTPAATVYELHGQYLAYLEIAVGYANQPPCTETRVTACSNEAVVALLQDTARKVDTALDAAQAAVRAGESPSSGNIRAAREGLSDFSTYLIEANRQ